MQARALPVTTKENVDQAGYPTTNGLRIQKDLIATEVDVAQRLRDDALQILLEKVEGMESDRVVVDPDTLEELRGTFDAAQRILDLVSQHRRHGGDRHARLGL